MRGCDISTQMRWSVRTYCKPGFLPKMMEHFYGILKVWILGEESEADWVAFVEQNLNFNRPNATIKKQVLHFFCIKTDEFCI